MATTPAARVSLEEYLNTNYEPDCDYVDGTLEDRNVGKQKHSQTQALLTAWLIVQAARHGKKDAYRAASSHIAHNSPDPGCVFD